MSSIVSFFLAILIAFLCVGSNTQIIWAKVRSSGKNTVEPSKENLALGLEKYKNHDLDGAIDAFLQAIYFNRSSYNPKAYYWLGICYKEKNLDTKAVEALKKSIEQTVGPCPDAHLNLARIYLRNDRLKEATDEANEAWVELKGVCPESQNILGLIAEKRGDFPGAEQHFVEALGYKKPWRYTEAWMNYAESLIKQKKWGDAVVQFNDMLNNQAPLKGINLEQIYLDIGICMLAKGDHQGAMDNWHETLNYNPDNAMAHLQLAMLLDSERHLSSAIKEYKEYIRLSSDNGQVAKIKNQVLKLEQILRSSQNTTSQPSAYPSGNNDHQPENETVNPNKGSKENSPIAPTKESGF